ncbi:MAG: acetyl-CoA carboxylase biotin carboxyl carrier protein subunit, partial [Gemmatimonadetes bacterium]|nr:acetyl-CoA carboxylase biotin carboxyl carrier protein subunit [Gemmatimonadota bacterium]
MTHSNRAFVVGVLAFAAGPLAAQGTSTAAPAPAPATSAAGAAPARPAAPFGSITYDRTGVGDTSLFAPLEL